MNSTDDDQWQFIHPFDCFLFQLVANIIFPRTLTTTNTNDHHRKDEKGVLFCKSTNYNTKKNNNSSTILLNDSLAYYFYCSLPQRRPFFIHELGFRVELQLLRWCSGTINFWRPSRKTLRQTVTRWVENKLKSSPHSDTCIIELGDLISCPLATAAKSQRKIKEIEERHWMNK